MKRKFELLLLKNTLAIALPALAIFVLLMVFLIKYPIFEKMDCNEITKESLVGTTLEQELKALHEKGTYNVQMEINSLYYTGFDYYVDNVKKGSYYYTMNDSKIHVYLLENTDKQEAIDKKTIRGKILKDTVSCNHILNQLAQGSGIENLARTGFFSDYIVSEIDYPEAYIRLVYLFYATPIAICGLILLYTLFVWINPRMHSQSRQLAIYGKISTIIKHIDKQFRNDYVYKKGNIYITSEYMVVSYLTKTDVIKLSMVKYISKNETEKKGLFGRKYTVYRLTLSSPDILFYEVDLGNEAVCDDVIDYIDTIKG